MKIIINTDEELMKKTIKNFYEVFKYRNTDEDNDDGIPKGYPELI